MIDRALALVGVRPGEGRTVAPALCLAFLAVGSMSLAAIAADTLFVSTFSLGALSRFFVISSVVRFVAALAYGALLARSPGARVDTALLVACAATLGASALVAGGGPTSVYAVSLVALLLPPLLPLVAFNAITACFHARQAKRLLPLVAAASTLGTIAVGASASALASTLGAQSLFWTSALLALLAVPLPALLARRAQALGATSGPSASLRPPATGLGAALQETARDFRQVPVVRVVVICAVLAAMTTNFVDFAFKAALKQRYDRDQMAAYLGVFSVVSNGMVLVAQVFLTRRFVERFGVRAGLSAFFVSLGALGPVLALAPGLGAATAAKGADSVLRFGLSGSVADLMLTPAPDLVRTRAKVLLKGAASPIGYAASALFLTGFGEAGPSFATLGVLVMTVTGLGLLAVASARRAYTEVLSKAIGEGRLVMDVSPAAAAVLRAELLRHLARNAAAAEPDESELRLVEGDRARRSSLPPRAARRAGAGDAGLAAGWRARRALGAGGAHAGHPRRPLLRRRRPDAGAAIALGAGAPLGSRGRAAHRARRRPAPRRWQDERRARSAVTAQRKPRHPGARRWPRQRPGGRERFGRAPARALRGRRRRRGRARRAGRGAPLGAPVPRERAQRAQVTAMAGGETPPRSRCGPRPSPAWRRPIAIRR
ncbi:MAG: hypothetical protein WKG00_30185 [Polyangiaceae bacterium]